MNECRRRRRHHHHHHHHHQPISHHGAAQPKLNCAFKNYKEVP